MVKAHINCIFFFWQEKASQIHQAQPHSMSDITTLKMIHHKLRVADMISLTLRSTNCNTPIRSNFDSIETLNQEQQNNLN